MTRYRRSQVFGMLAVAAATGAGALDAGCPCQRGNVSSMAPVPMAMPETSLPMAGPVSGPVYLPPPTTASVQPPPGTLGRTYQMKSRPVPASMHPRTAMIDVRIPGASEVLIHDMNEFRMEDSLDGFQDPDDPNMWHFQTDPLLPGLPHIYRIEARIPGADGVKMEQRYVRLIMGRLIEVAF